ncbi:MAG TPA: hypothetical protein VM286_01035 [Candidatus Thermoplasmatota archaeon]|nr:hypothetical protein [Candidatus Thermoplasmatota archaeon]
MAPRIAVMLLALAGLALPAAEAHIGLTVTPPTTPIPPFKPSAIQVTAAAECADMFITVPPPSSVSRALALAPDTPKALAWTGQTLTMPLSGCAPSGSSSASGTITVVPHQGLGAFADLPFMVVCDDCEDGDFTLRIGYYGNLTATAPPPVQLGGSSSLKVAVATNYDTDLKVTVSKPGLHATLADLPAIVPVTSPLLELMLNRTVSIPLKPTATTAGWATDSIELSLVAEARGKGANGTVLKVVVPITNPDPAGGSQTSTATGAGTSTHGTSTKSTGSATSPARATISGTTSGTSSTKSTPGWTPVALLAFVGIAAVLRRRT